MTQEFRSNQTLLGLNDKEKRLTVLIAGYLADNHPPTLVAAFISNFQNFESGFDKPEADDAFKVIFEREKNNPRSKNPTLIQRIGLWNATTERDERSLRRALEKKLSEKTIAEMGVGIIRRISEEYPLLVNKDIMKVVLPSDVSSQPYGEYYNHISANKIFSPDTIVQAKKEGFMVKNLEIKLDSGKKEFLGKVGKNELCPCGSGKRYKKCCRNY